MYSLRPIESVVGKACPPHKHVSRVTLSMGRREYGTTLRYDIICTKTTKCNIYCLCGCMIKWGLLNYVTCVNVLQITDFNGKIIVYGCTDLAFLTVGNWRESLGFPLTVAYWRERFRFILMVGDGNRKPDAEDLPWRFQPSGTNQWWFSIREDGLSLSVYPWRSIPDGSRHR
jgi:hypothetical protein